jgi:hypothetical protein
MKGPVLGEDDIKAFLAVSEDMKRWNAARF